MYAILNELAVTKENKLECEIFGVRIGNTVEGRLDLEKAKAVLKSMRRNPKVLDYYNTMLGRLVKDSEKEQIFRKTCNMNLFHQANSGEDLLEIIKGDEEELGYHEFKSVCPYLGATSNSTVYDEMLYIAEHYFENKENALDSMQISKRLVRFLEITRNLDLKIYKATETKTFYIDQEEPCKITWNARFLLLLRANALSLMFLTNRATYVEEEGKEIPIVIGGIEHQSQTKKRVLVANTHYYKNI